MSNNQDSVVLALVVPGMPHPLLRPEGNPSWAALRDGYAAARQAVIDSGAELLLIYSTQWFSILGHQMQADPNPEWVHVDPEFHELGTMPYSFKVDADFSEAYAEAARARNLHARTIAYKGFPIDTGSIVALQLLNPDNRIPASIVSCNMYADRSETVILGKAARDAIDNCGKKVAVVAVSCLSNRLHTAAVEDADDHLSSQMDDEWNRKLLELLGEGRLEDVSQLARTFAAQAHADNKLKAFWWLSAVAGQHNRYQGIVHAYGPVFGTGCAVVTLQPAEQEASGHEFDEDNVEVYAGERGVLGKSIQPTDAPIQTVPSLTKSPHISSATESQIDRSKDGVVKADAAPKPVGAYPHARRVGDLLYLSGVGPRTPGTDAIPGGPICDSDGAPLDYDIEAQTQAVIDNVSIILQACGSSLERVIDVTAFLVDMDRDFKGYNRVYAKTFTEIQATRTTLSIRALPTPIAVEFKVIAYAGDVDVPGL